ncbi:DNA phosphorothioation-dependent restriction protein DptH [Exiguobacterium profundum]|uniref:DNA phosphorothioation-dependent restriction protein DptH n=1 Tax=Exiguobacterium profundum TaxID=307643 RepID=UPI0028AA6A5F|nr:DNA phosphorothioation-dependent restriction protein DptH [Exiguobacterium profundum]
MSNQFYEFITQQLLQFFKHEIQQNRTDRYYVYLPTKQDVKEMYDALSGLSVSETFTYKHPFGKENYVTNSLNFSTGKLVIASSLDTDIDYLVTLRNEMSEQSGQWSNTSLMILTDNLNDSIRGGSIDLTSEGRPLHISKIIQHLDQHLASSDLSKSEQMIIADYLKRRNQQKQITNGSFLDFIDILGLLHKDTLDSDDYTSLQYFQDGDLSSLIRERDEKNVGSASWKKINRQIENRLSENHELFEDVERYFTLGNTREKLEERFDNGATKLKEDTWQQADYTVLKEWEEKAKSNRDIQFISEKMIAKTDGSKLSTSHFWKRPQSETKSGQRTWHIIVFSTQEADKVQIHLPFDRFTSKQFLDNKSAKSTVSSGHSLITTIENNSTQVTFSRVRYKHEGQTSTTYLFNIAVVPLSPEFLNPYQSRYFIDTTPKNQQAIRLILDGHHLVELGDGSGQINDVVVGSSEAIKIGHNDVITLPLNALDEGESRVRFSVMIDEVEVPLAIKDEMLKTTPLDGVSIWTRKRTDETSFLIDSDYKTIHNGQRTYSTKSIDRNFFKMEQDWLDNHVRYAKQLSDDTFESIPLELPSAVETSYDLFLNTVKSKGTIPSLMYYDDQVQSAAFDFINNYLSEIEKIKAQSLMTVQQRNLYRLGQMETIDGLLLTPFSPLNIAYQWQVNSNLGSEDIDSNILKKLKASYTLPYAFNVHEMLLKPTDYSPLPEWHEYVIREKVSIGETNSYLAKVVEEKMTHFADHYDYLFSIQNSAPLCINVINVTNDEEILKGIISWFKNQISSKGVLENIKPLEVSLYLPNASGLSAFDTLNEIETAEQLKEEFGIDLSIDDFEIDDVLHVLQQSILYRKLDLKEPILYSHISFYKMGNESRIVTQPMRDLSNSMNLDGLFTTVSSVQSDDTGYRVGFGTKGADINRSLMTKFGSLYNELTANMKDGGHSSYMKDVSLTMHIDVADKDELEKIYSASHWVTFIDPPVGLDFFKSSSDNLIIVHYSDQYSSTNGYDAITVTDKSKQYFNVIEEFVNSQGVTSTQEQIEETIRAFNTFNGEWLLRAVQGRGYDKREKMSIVSAIKETLLLFNEENTIWVPISMEEVVRVTGNVKLSKRAGLFSGKTIGRKGNCSDDLLMIGLEIDQTQLKVHLFPVEVKIGINDNSVISKGISQITELKARLNDHLLDLTTFDAKFLRNYFVRLFINNAKKMQENEIWPSKDFRLSAELIDRLMNDDFKIVDEKRAKFGNGVLVSFKKHSESVRHSRSQGVVILELPEQHGYEALTQSLDSLESSKKQKSLAPTFKNEAFASPADSTEQQKSTDELEDRRNLPEDENHTVVEPDLKIAPLTQPNLELVTPNVVSLEQVRLHLGSELNQDYYWEYGHPRLSNRHLLIGGRSGQGKTYFVQSLLLQLVEQNQSALVIDYSNSYTLSQLDETFVNRMGEKLTERIVYHESFPLNPFKRREKEISGRKEPEKIVEVARRVAAVFASVYRGLGDQQKNAIYMATKNGIEKYGEDMRMELLIEELENLETSSKSTIQSVISRLTQMVDMDPFDYESDNDWSKIFESNGVTVIQLEGYDQDEIKKLLAEFILWDLWYYSLSGSKDKPMPVILDEAQNLSFRDDSPSAKILREGRKFGWSAWFATQSFSNFDKEELAILDNAGTKIYFAPADSELKVIANRIGTISLDDLRSLKKAHCLAVGQFKISDVELSNQEFHHVQVPPMK